jgi:hypothetical protein
MSRTQRFFKMIFPKKWFESVEAESRDWMYRCKCGATQSVWDAGGIRWKASGRSWQYRRCATCGKRSWQALEKSKDAPNAN